MKCYKQQIHTAKFNPVMHSFATPTFVTTPTPIATKQLKRKRLSKISLGKFFIQSLYFNIWCCTGCMKKQLTVLNQFKLTITYCSISTWLVDPRQVDMRTLKHLSHTIQKFYVLHAGTRTVAK